jgi:hypothetical protein
MNEKSGVAIRHVAAIADQKLGKPTEIAAKRIQRRSVAPLEIAAVGQTIAGHVLEVIVMPDQLAIEIAVLVEARDLFLGAVADRATPRFIDLKEAADGTERDCAVVFEEMNEEMSVFVAIEAD